MVKGITNSPCNLDKYEHCRKIRALDVCHRPPAGTALERAGRPVLFRLFKLSIRNIWQGFACALPVVLLIGYLIHFYNDTGATNKFLIREGFRGQIIIVYDWPGGVTPATRKDTTIFVIPPDGLLKVNILYESTNLSTSSWFYMGLGDTTRKEIQYFTFDLPIDTSQAQILNSGSGGFTTDGIEYRTESFVINIPDSSFNKQIGKYKDEKYRRLYRLAHGDEAYYQLFGTEKIKVVNYAL